MSNRPGILITEPVAILNKKLNIDARSVFTGITKAVANAATGNLGNVPENIVDIGAAIGLAKEPGELAWILIFHSLTQAMLSLVEDNQDLVREANRSKEVNTDDLQVISKHRLNQSLEKLEEEQITIYQDFFEHPKDLAIVETIKKPFAEWLEDINLNKAQAKAISDRLPDEFVNALHIEWAEHSDKYARLQSELDTPFIKAVERNAKRELSWQRYSVWLQNQINQRVFSEAFTLKDVYVPLRAYYEERKDEEREKEIQRVVVDLETELQTWLDKADKADAIRVISGGPGSGKSSFAKIFTAKQAVIFTTKQIDKVKIPVLFIPLHLFNPEGDLVNEIGKFIKSMRDIPLPPNPLELDNYMSRLLIIFDGLDELAMQGKIAEDVAQKFINEVIQQVSSANYSQTHLQVLISGRELVVQNNSSEFRQPKQILHILPYFVDENERNNYSDDNNLLDEDQRQRWWKSYGAVSGHEYPGLPENLDQGHLREITSQPLLNYLVALSYEQGELVFSEDSNLNEIYADLLTRVYKRVWAEDNQDIKNPHLKGVEKEDFIGILEGIAVAAWHGGDGRTTTVKEIETNCEPDILRRVLAIFKEQDAKAGVTRLLTAFYFRKSGYKQNEETFEFTHKSFGEYLTARRIVKEIERFQEIKEFSKNNKYIKWDEKEALKDWAKLCGSTAMDKYLFKFVVDEIRLKQERADVSEWQQILCDLISFMLHNGMPMELLTDIKSFHQANQQARNAEEALLAVLNACARVTRNVSKIKWPSPEAFGSWISRLQGQRGDTDTDVFCLNCLSFLDLRDCVLVFKDLYKANLVQGNLVEANLAGAFLARAFLVGANLVQANLEWANLVEANLLQANLVEANLLRANLVEANLLRANLEGANLRGANLLRAILVEANLEGANLEEANLEEANLLRANLEGANLRGADLRGADLEWPRLTQANFEGEDLADLNEDSGSDSNE
ncbi:pentapeptide repeat-containing protein [Nostoc sp. UHCC 0302]|uniref:pentapeptide repeat-containing protein n=1 Tax=Nostoc sp. UHCC 0302 TaxID=3134896 RepID=UPI00311C911C